MEHAAVKDLIAQVGGVAPGGVICKARVKVMGEFVKHHVKEPPSERFPKAKETGFDTVAMSQKMLRRKQKLLATRS